MTLAPPKPTSLGLGLLSEDIRTQMDSILLKQVRQVRWRCAFFSGLVSGATFYNKVQDEMFRPPKFPKGGIKIGLVLARFGEAGTHFDFRVETRPSGARSYLIYDAARPERLAFAGLIDSFDAPEYIGFNVLLEYTGPTMLCRIDKPTNTATIEVIEFPPEIFTPASTSAVMKGRVLNNHGKSGYLIDGLWWPDESLQG
jgi:hypothetical protein